MLKALALSVFAITLCANALAKPMAAEIFQRDLYLDYKFNGTNVLVFGYRREPGEIFAVVEGDNKNYLVRSKAKKFGLWVKDKEEKIHNVKSFYSVYSSSSPDQISDVIRSTFDVGVDQVSGGSEKSNSAEMLNAFRLQMLKQGNYSESFESIKFLDDDRSMFTFNIYFSHKVAAGKYTVTLYLIDKDVINAMQISSFEIKKSRFVEQIYWLSKSHPAIYGAFCVVGAIVAGIAACIVVSSVSKRRRRRYKLNS